MKSAPQNIDVRQKILDAAQAIMSDRGFSAVGLNEILIGAGVPKGSFYYYFKSKEAFGEALLQRYFDDYLESVDQLFGQADLNGAEKLLRYWQNWLTIQTAPDPQNKCLVVKLAAEVADLSDGMRNVLLRGTTGIIAGLTRVIEEGVDDGSLIIDGAPSRLAETLYQMWLGASLLAKISKDDAPLQASMGATRKLLGVGDGD